MSKRVLFVDDNDRVLGGLRRMLRAQRGSWDMHFVSSGDAALNLMTAGPFDVVVSDMRMPGMSGVEFLGHVRERYPGSVRIGLSGYSESELILEAAGATHQYLTKPCNAEELTGIVERSCALQKRLSDRALREVLASMTTVPVLPQLYNEIMRELQSDEPCIQRVGEIVANDVGMSARLMQLVNSSYFGLRRHVASPVEAVMLIGLTTVRALVLRTKIFSSFENLEASGVTASGLSRDGLRVASLSKHLAPTLGLSEKDTDFAFIAGILHNLGRLVLAANFPDRYRATVTRRHDEEVTADVVEIDEFGTTSREVGAYLLDLWGLPHPVVEALAFYDNPSASSVAVPIPLTAVHLAISMLGRPSIEAAMASLDSGYLERLSLCDEVPLLVEAYRVWSDQEEIDR